MDPSLRLIPEDAVEHISRVVSGIDGQVLFVNCVDADGYVGDANCFASKEGKLEEIPPHYLFGIAQEKGAPAVLLTSRFDGDMPVLDESNVTFTRKVLVMGETLGIEVVDHYLVGSEGRVSLRETTDLWD